MDNTITNSPIEGLLSNPDSMAEHIASKVGLSSLLNGEIGDSYRPTASPFYSMAKKASSESDPKISTIKDTVKMGDSALKNIQKQSAAIFGKGENVVPDEMHESEIHSLYDKSSSLGISPEVLIDHLSKQTAPLAEHAPDLAYGLSKLSNNAIILLQGESPHLSPGAPLDTPREASPSQISKFNDTAKLVDNPLLLLKRIQNGTLTEKHVNTVQSIYPTVLENIKQEVMKNLIDHQAGEGDPLPSSLRLSLSKLFGQNMDSSLAGLAKNQMALSGIEMAKQPQAAAPTKPSKSGIGKMKLGTMDQTRAQQSAERTAS